MDRMEEVRAKHFGKFLFQHRLFDMWFENLFKQHEYHESRGVPQYKKDGNFLMLLCKCKDIDNSFCWSDTPQGHYFWSQKHEQEKASWDNTKRDMQIMSMPTPLCTVFYD
jgi:hypothetical protein